MSLADRANNAYIEHKEPLADDQTTAVMAEQERQSREKSLLRAILAAYISDWANRLGTTTRILSEEYIAEHQWQEAIHSEWNGTTYSPRSIESHVTVTFVAEEIEFTAYIHCQPSKESASYMARNNCGSYVEVLQDNGNWYVVAIWLKRDGHRLQGKASRLIRSLADLGEALNG